MINKKYLWLTFAVMMVVQIAIPLQMITTSEATMQHGEIFMFKTVPVDPEDPFRGKFIRLRYEVEQGKYRMKNGGLITANQAAFATLVNQDGFAKIATVTVDRPSEKVPYISVKVRSHVNDDAYIELPFDKYFLEESVAQPAEDAVRNLQSDTTAMVYAKVRVLDGNAVLQDVYINEEPIADYVRRNR